MSKKKKILVVDDDEAITESIQFILEDAGYSVITTIDSRQVPELLKQQPSLILLDIWMPGVDGRDVCQALKANDATKNIPVIMISATFNTKEIAEESGANDFIMKPFEMKKLLAKIAKYI